MRDRDRLRQEILEAKGWNIHRIWSTSWFHTRSAEIDRLKLAIEEQLRHDRIAARGVVEDPPEIQPSAEQMRLEVAEEELDTNSELRVALERFWTQNLENGRSNRDESLLSPAMIDHLVEKQPVTLTLFMRDVPPELWASVGILERQYLEDVLEIVNEFV